MRYKEILELRSNPEINQRKTVRSELEKYENGNYFLSFTRINKLGINPYNNFETPYGIYTYPITEVVEAIDVLGGIEELPFAGSRKFIWVLTPVGKGIDTSSYTEAEYIKDKGILISHFSRYEDSMKMTVEDTIEEAEENAKFSDIPAGKLWNVVRIFSSIIADNNAITSNIEEKIKTNKKSTVIWNKIFRDILGYGYVTDTFGIIHINEETQAVFFSIKSFKVIEKIINDYQHPRNNTIRKLESRPLFSVGVNPEQQETIFAKDPKLITRLKLPLIPRLQKELNKYDLVVTEPGLSPAYYGQLMTNKEYEDFKKEFGEDVIEIRPIPKSS